jgi:hypothetical protein
MSRMYPYRSSSRQPCFCYHTHHERRKYNQIRPEPTGRGSRYIQSQSTPTRHRPLIRTWSRSGDVLVPDGFAYWGRRRLEGGSYGLVLGRCEYGVEECDVRKGASVETGFFLQASNCTYAALR